jgi:hypothetical protein
VPLSTRETVAGETRARRETPLMVATAHLSSGGRSGTPIGAP